MGVKQVLVLGFIHLVFADLMDVHRNPALMTSVADTSDLGFDIVRMRPGMRAELRNIPDNFDSRKKWPQCKSIDKIRNQGNCSSGWALTAASTLSDRTCTTSNGTLQVYYLNEDIMSCCRDCAVHNNPCKGGDPVGAWNYWVNYGYANSSEYDSSHGCEPTALKCNRVCINGKYRKEYSRVKYYGKQVYLVGSHMTDIQTEILTKGPVHAIFDLYDDFLDYKNGTISSVPQMSASFPIFRFIRRLKQTLPQIMLYDGPPGTYVHENGEHRGQHSGKIIGWGVDEKKQSYWLMSNSWGEKWGEMGGFYHFLRGSNHCGVENKVIAGSVKINKIKSTPTAEKNEAAYSVSAIGLQFYFCRIILNFFF